MTDEKRGPKVIDCPDIREVYSDKVVSSYIGGGGLIITLGCTRLTPDQADQPPGQLQNPPVYVNNRLALSPQAAVELINGLRNLLTAAQQAAQKQAEAAAKAPAAVPVAAPKPS